MKATLLSALALGVSTMAFAIDEPYIQPSSAIMGFSPDNTVAVSNYYGSMFIFDLESGEEPRIFAESADGLTSYTVGNGNFIGNNAICASRGSRYGASAYLYGASGAVNGRFVVISNDVAAGTGGANGVTPDGTRFCGNAPTGVEFGIDAEGTMVLPCVWNRSGNTFTRVMLPHPEKDYIGLAPQYITALAISSDGKTVIGQVRSYNGFITEYLIYTENEDGTWSYRKPFDALVNPNNIVAPENPGEGPATVSQEKFMTEEEFNSYLAALSAYYENPVGEMPSYEQFMTPEEIAAYNEALKPYNEWAEKYLAFEEADMKIREESTSFTFNTGAISPNGKYFVASSETGYYDEDMAYHAVYAPVLYDIENDKILVNGGPSILVTAVSDDGTIVGYERHDDIDFGYVLPAGATEWVPFEKWVVERNPSLAEWVEQNWKHEVEVVIDVEENITDFQEMYITGMPFMSQDFSMASTVAYYFWNDAPEELRSDYNSCIIPLTDTSAIRDVEAVGESEGKAEFFNLQGIRVAEPEHGIYIRRQGSNVSKIRK